MLGPKLYLMMFSWGFEINLETIDAIMLDQLNTDDGDFDVACRWLQANEDKWTTWIPEQGKCFTQFGMYNATWMCRQMCRIGVHRSGDHGQAQWNTHHGKGEHEEREIWARLPKFLWKGAAAWDFGMVQTCAKLTTLRWNTQMLLAKYVKC